MVRVPRAALATPQQTSKPLMTCLNKSRDAIRSRGEADADFSQAPEVTGSFPPSPQFSEAREGRVAGRWPTSKFGPSECAPGLPGVSEVFL